MLFPESCHLEQRGWCARSKVQLVFRGQGNSFNNFWLGKGDGGDIEIQYADYHTTLVLINGVVVHVLEILC